MGLTLTLAYTNSNVIRISVQVFQITRDVILSKNVSFPIPTCKGEHDAINLISHLDTFFNPRLATDLTSSDRRYGYEQILKKIWIVIRLGYLSNSTARKINNTRMGKGIESLAESRI